MRKCSLSLVLFSCIISVVILISDSVYSMANLRSPLKFICKLGLHEGIHTYTCAVIRILFTFFLKKVCVF